MKIAISENIKRLRKEKNITQAELAAKFGTTCQSVCRWENGATYPDIELIPEIAAFFGVTTDVLLGCDNESVESKIRKVFHIDILSEEDVKEKICKMRKIMAELPYEPQIKYHILRQYHILGANEAAKNITELREFADFICASDAAYWIKHNTRVTMVDIETDEEACMPWLEQIGNDYITPDEALLNRYEYQEQYDFFNLKAQENLVAQLTKIFIKGFKKKNDPEYKKRASITILNMIDSMRDKHIDTDGWMRHRAHIKFRLAAAEFELGNTEDGYTALEEGVDLLVKIVELPDDFVVGYNTPLLDLIKRDKEWLISPISDMLKQILTEPYGPWDGFKPVSDTDRFKETVKKITKYFDEQPDNIGI